MVGDGTQGTRHGVGGNERAAQVREDGEARLQVDLARATRNAAPNQEAWSLPLRPGFLPADEYPALIENIAAGGFAVPTVRTRPTSTSVSPACSTESKRSSPAGERTRRRADANHPQRPIVSVPSNALTSARHTKRTAGRLIDRSRPSVAVTT